MRKAVRYTHRNFNDWNGDKHNYLWVTYEHGWIWFGVIILPIEYLSSFILIIMNIPVARLSSVMKIPIGGGFSIDICLLYYILNAISIPFFLSAVKQTWIRAQSDIRTAWKKHYKWKDGQKND